jgi:PhzF family phenazine biosynthesis protein
MDVFYATAFSDAEMIEHKTISGNPAAVVVCKNGLPSKEMMVRMAVEVNQPIVAFISQRNGHEFDLKFYFPDGEDCFLCGHGTLVSAYFVNKLFNYNKVTFKIHEHELVINCELDEAKMVKAYFEPYQLAQMPPDKLSVYLDLLGLTENDLLDKFYSNDLNDCVLVFKDCAKLRSLNPHYKKLSAQIRQDHLRAIMITAVSQNKDIDYEIRIFCPYVEQDEDISCGSANCYLLPYWKKALHKENEKNDLTILCPFKPSSASFGGVEHGNYYDINQMVSIAGKINEI